MLQTFAGSLGHRYDRESICTRELRESTSLDRLSQCCLDDLHPRKCGSYTVIAHGAACPAAAAAVDRPLAPAGAPCPRPVCSGEQLPCAHSPFSCAVPRLYEMSCLARAMTAPHVSRVFIQRHGFGTVVVRPPCEAESAMMDLS